MSRKHQYIELDFYKLWKYIRISRQRKELLKSLLFSNLPIVFNKFAAYHNWKDARIFCTKKEEPVVNSLINQKNKIENSYEKTKLAIVLHVFYIEIFKEILLKVLSWESTNIKFFITCPRNLTAILNENLKNTNIPYNIMEVKNQGRDILPFVKVLTKVFDENFTQLLKIHTKGSNYLDKKDLWSTDIFDKLLKKENMQNALQIFSNYPKVGMIGPAGHILPMSLYYGGNAKIVQNLSLKMGVKKEQLCGMNFVAGSMFYARKDVLLPILKLKLSNNDFENEDKQLDNTMAHAVERTFAAGLLVVDKKLADTSSTPDNISCQITINHPFTI